MEKEIERLVKEDIKVLIACEFSGRVREAFRKRGFNAYSCDLLPAEDESKYHIQDDVLKHINEGWDLIIAHPPCTYLANSGVRWFYESKERWEDSGVRWFYERKERWEKMEKATEFFKKFLYANCPHIAIENPIMHHFALKRIGHKYSQIIQPWQFGEPYSKATCLWLKNLPLLKPTKIIPKKQIKQQVWKEPPSKNRWKNRSRTYIGIAEAMAEQWGTFLKRDREL